MHILNPMLCYNSLDIIPYVIEYNLKEDIDLFILDNYSTDGSWEYIQDNKIPSRRVDSGDAFDLNILLKAKEKLIHEIKPDWVIISGSDCFILTPKPLIETVKKLDYLNFDITSIPFIRLYNTGEKRTHPDPRKVFFNYSDVAFDLPFLHPYKNFVSYFNGDYIKMRCMENLQNAIINEACVLDYGNTRGKEKRDEEYHRRVLAWNRGLPERYGIHYKECSEKGWLWDKKEMKDIRKSKYWNLIDNKFNS